MNRAEPNMRAAGFHTGFWLRGGKLIQHITKHDITSSWLYKYISLTVT